MFHVINETIFPLYSFIESIILVHSMLRLDATTYKKKVRWKTFQIQKI